MKSGTSSLYACVAQHPQCAPSYIKEVHFFDGGIQPKQDNFEKGEAWYQAHFPLQCALKTKAEHHAFEATPGYVFYPSVAKRIFAFNPKIKLIMLLRNPTERAISHYFHALRQGREAIPIMEALQAEDDNWHESIDDNNQKSFYTFSYKKRGLYAQQIKRFLEYFPEKQVLVLNSTLFFKHPEHILKQVFEFVGVDAEFEVKNLTPRNVANNKTAVDAEVRQYLNDYFLPHNKQLYALLGEDFGWEKPYLIEN